jgi:tol-pal system protein YbgF
MMRLNSIAQGVAFAVALALAAPTTAEAAWWPWSKNKDKPPAAATEQPLDPGDPGDRMARLEQQVRDLTGQVEELTYEVRELQGALQQMQAGKKPQAAAPKMQSGAPPADVASGAKVVPDETPVAAVTGTEKVAAGAPGSSAEAGAPARALEPLAGDAEPGMVSEGQPIDLTAMPGVPPADDATPAAAVVARSKTKVLASLGDPSSDYDRAYNSIITGDYDVAEVAFRNFLAAYPDDQRAPDAQFWLGESLFARGKYREAATEFLNGHKAYPKSNKGPDTLLKLGLSLAGLGEREAACSTYAQVLKQYPQASNALRQRVATERASANC